MNYDEFKQLCRKSWGDENNCLPSDGSKNMMEDTVFLMKAKTHTLNAFRKLNLFNKMNVTYN